MFESINQFKNELSIENHNLQLTVAGFRPIHRAIFDHLNKIDPFFNKEDYSKKILEFKDEERKLSLMKEKINLLESTFDICLEDMGLLSDFKKIVREDKREIFFICFEGEFLIDSMVETLLNKLLRKYEKNIDQDLYSFILRSFIKSFEEDPGRAVINLNKFCRTFIHMAKLYKRRRPPVEDEIKFYNGLMDFGHWIISKHDHLNKLVA